MFGKGSRYQNLDESSPVNAGGERLRGKELRYIPAAAGSYQHAVSEGDRLDLLAYKYYGDSTRWWQISDANPGHLFPTDLLDRAPVVGKRLSLVHATFQQRLALLLEDLRASGELISVENLPDDATGGDFLRSTIAVEYEPSDDTHAFVLGKLESQKIGFHLLDSRRWGGGDQGSRVVEAFSFDDVNAVADWHEMITALEDVDGVLNVRSRLMGVTLDVFYLETKVGDAEIVAVIEAKGFRLAGADALSSRIGARVVVPPNQIA
jgi:copper chaperone CopZ